MLKDKLLALIDQLDDHSLVRVFDVKDDRLVPNRSCADSRVCLCIGVVLEDLDNVLAVLQVLGVYNVHF